MQGTRHAMTSEQLQWCERLRSKYIGSRFLVSEEQDGHCWGVMKDSAVGKGMEMCLFCLAMCRADKNHKPCDGPRKISIRN